MRVIQTVLNCKQSRPTGYFPFKTFIDSSILILFVHLVSIAYQTVVNCVQMANNDERNMILQLFMDDDDIVVVLLSLWYWRRVTSPLTMWLLRKRLTLQRIVQERRIGILGYLVDVIPLYHNIQFHEHFRMSKSTFEVQISLQTVTH